MSRELEDFGYNEVLRDIYSFPGFPMVCTVYNGLPVVRSPSSFRLTTVYPTWPEIFDDTKKPSGVSFTLGVCLCVKPKRVFFPVSAVFCSSFQTLSEKSYRFVV
ncbi:hypothetical protein RRG08_066596 [Elysia crispata]|uniref:Uncharacterized protein n=1 Tax=Elysia crispata TaxID=231223 RepID=A0AAE0XWD7_9GAST|nr:hypothetical protein RRG08_066596 [Elysia crispata]